MTSESYEKKEGMLMYWEMQGPWQAIILAKLQNPSPYKLLLPYNKLILELEQGGLILSSLSCKPAFKLKAA